MYDYRFSDAAFATWVLMRQTWAAMHKAAERQLTELGLTPELVEVLWVCRDCAGPLTPAELSRVLFRESQTLAGSLDRMEREGLVKRDRKRKGHPFTEVQITAKGEERCRPGVEVLMSLIPKFTSSFSAEELEELQRLLRKLRKNALDDLRVKLKPAPAKPYDEAIKRAGLIEVV